MAYSHSEGQVALLFQTRDDNTDVVFIVEEKPVYFCRALLKVSSPVFAKMFSAYFKEKEQEEIPLPGKSLADFVRFLTQLHPVHSWEALSGKCGLGLYLTSTGLSACLSVRPPSVFRLSGKCRQGFLPVCLSVHPACSVWLIL